MASLEISQFDATCPECLRQHQNLLNDADGAMCVACHNLSTAGLAAQKRALLTRLGVAEYNRRQHAAEVALL